MEPRDGSSDDVTLGGVGSSIKDPSSSGSNPSDAPTYISDSAATVTPISTGSGSAAAAARAKINVAAIVEAGTLLGGRYEIQQILGIGGMGAVYKAHDRDIDRTVALKVIRPDLADNAEVVARFKQELLLAREVSHKNVIRIFDVRECAGIKFINMEYVAGQDLRGLLADRGKLPADEALRITRQICAGLAAAHTEGVIHRDLKPSNVMIDQQGRVVVMDFGLARTLAGDGMTNTGAMLGTMESMSPEQAKAEKLDASSDLFTVGLIFYELLTGKLPYKADSPLASLLKRSQERAQPISDVDPTLPRSLSDVVAKCLECDPKNRYQTMQEMLTQLDIIEGRHPASVFPPV